jgi:hypothetical protein
MSLTLDEYYNGNKEQLNRVNISEESPLDMLELLENTNDYIFTMFFFCDSEKMFRVNRCKMIERYMTLDEYDNSKLLSIFFSAGNASFYEEELKFYIKNIGCIDGNLINVSDICNNFSVLFMSNINDKSLNIVKYLFNVINFDQSTIRDFLYISISKHQPLITSFLIGYFYGSINSIEISEVKESDNLETLSVLIDAGFTLPENTSKFLIKKKEELESLIERSNKGKLSPKFPIFIR